jgi:haloacetate dehalogenase
MFAGFERRTVACGDIAINCVVGGTGAPVLLLHGYPQNLSMWAKVASALARHYTVVCADLRGYGDSSKPHATADNSNYSFRAMAADQVAVMRALGFARFHLVGHDRGGRTAHRLTLDHPDAVRSLTLFDIAPTYTTLTALSRPLAQRYWHWYFLSRPEPLPERLIGADPDFFYEGLLGSLGTIAGKPSGLENFDPEQLAEYRRCWRDPAMIHATCADYRATITHDLAFDTADHGTRKVTCPAFAVWGATGAMAQLFDVEARWREWCTDLRTASLPSGHFFVDHMPAETTTLLLDFWRECGD